MKYHPKRTMHKQFRIRDILMCVLIVGICAGWWVDHHKLLRKLESQTAALDDWELKSLQLHFMAHSNPPPTIDDVMRVLGIESGGRIQTRNWLGPDAVDKLRQQMVDQLEEDH
jgi:hypothetical protein